jgi:hypothetical protein
VEKNNMKWFWDIFNQQVSLAPEVEEHIKDTHPEMSGQDDKIRTTLLNPDVVVRSGSDPKSILYHRYFDATPVGIKYLCVVVKILSNERFISTAYFRPTVKKGVILWKKK